MEVNAIQAAERIGEIVVANQQIRDEIDRLQATGVNRDDIQIQGLSSTLSSNEAELLDLEQIMLQDRLVDAAQVSTRTGHASQPDIVRKVAAGLEHLTHKKDALAEDRQDMHD